MVELIAKIAPPFPEDILCEKSVFEIMTFEFSEYNPPPRFELPRFILKFSILTVSLITFKTEI